MKTSFEWKNESQIPFFVGFDGESKIIFLEIIFTEYLE